ncbi:MAG TPA: hypothetical protein VFK23_05440 [Nitrospirota bacterium]|nr:hypothetical protein [Nitrospirota bacterium]
MNKYVYSLCVALLFAALSGCGAAKMIAAKTQSERSDIFTEAAGSEPAPAGYADVIITADIKTHLEGCYKGESASSAHGKEAYPYLFNIDGQAVLWKAEGKKHELPKYDPDGKTSRNPEAGEGMKYVLKKKIRLQAGAHRLFFGLPEDDYYREIPILVKEGETLPLDFKPVYRYKTLPTRTQTFMRGVSHYDIFVNNVLVTQ